MRNRFRDELKRAAIPLARLIGAVPGSAAVGGVGFTRSWALGPEDVDYHNAFKLIPTIQFCVELYQTTISATPLRFYSGQGDTKEEIQRAPGNIVDLWHRGNTEDTGVDLLEQIVGSRQLQGNAYLFKDYLGSSTPKQFWCLNPLLVRPITGAGGRGVIEYEVRDGSSFIRIPRQQIVHFKRYDPDFGTTGVSRVGALRLSYETQRDASRFMRAFYKRGGTVAGHYSTEQALDVDEVDALKKDLHERVQGPEHAWEPVILPRKLKFERAGLTFSEMEFIDSERLTTEQMLRVFRIHPILASQNVSAGLNSDIANTAMLMFLRFGIFPEARAIASTLNERLLSTGEFGSPISCEFDFSNDPVLVESWLKQAEAWVRATGAPVATRAEARDKLGLPNISDEFPELDDPLVPMGMSTEAQTEEPASTDESNATDSTPMDSNAVEDTLASVEQSRSLDPIERDAMRVRSDKTLAIYERRIEAEALRIFAKQRLAILAKLKEMDSKHRIFISRSVDIDALLGTIDDEEQRRKIKRLLRAIVRDAGDAALADLAQDLAFDIAAKNVAKFIEEKSAKFVTEINSTTRAALRDQLAEGVANQETLGELVARVNDVFDGRRSNAATIARTETAPAFNFANQEAWAQSGVVESKQWLTAGDDAVRDEHRAADSQTVPLDESFTVGGEELDFPGDPNGSAGNVINCRCTMVPVVVDPNKGKAQTNSLSMRNNSSENGSNNGFLKFEDWMKANDF
jgi:HK97 family phage portal protein